VKGVPPLTQRQAEVAERVARGLPDKRIAHELRISTHTVRLHVQQAAARIPGDAPPRRKLTLFFFGIADAP
jgi:DNA-binding CsgD family transcriptional regulator